MIPPEAADVDGSWMPFPGCAPLVNALRSRVKFEFAAVDERCPPPRLPEHCTATEYRVSVIVPATGSSSTRAPWLRLSCLEIQLFERAGLDSGPRVIVLMVPLTAPPVRPLGSIPLPFSRPSDHCFRVPSAESPPSSPFESFGPGSETKRRKGPRGACVAGSLRGADLEDAAEAPVCQPAEIAKAGRRGSGNGKLLPSIRARTRGRRPFRLSRCDVACRLGAISRRETEGLPESAAPRPWSSTNLQEEACCSGPSSLWSWGGRRVFAGKAGPEPVSDDASRSSRTGARSITGCSSDSPPLVSMKAWIATSRAWLGRGPPKSSSCGGLPGPSSPPRPPARRALFVRLSLAEPWTPGTGFPKGVLSIPRKRARPPTYPRRTPHEELLLLGRSSVPIFLTDPRRPGWPSGPS